MHQAPEPRRKEGVFQKDLNIEILALLAKEQLKMIQPSKAFVNHSVTEVFQTVLLLFSGVSAQRKVCDFRALRLETFVRYVVKKGIIQNYIQIKSI